MGEVQVIRRSSVSLKNLWPSKTNLEKLIERSVFKNNRCFACGSLVYAVEKKLTSNHIYHDRCFRCRICKRNLTGLSLNEEGDDIYCTNCYKKKERGDCNSASFRRAASERAQYVYHARHPDVPEQKPVRRPPIDRSLSRHPSWILRQLEREFLSYQPMRSLSSGSFDKADKQPTAKRRPPAIKTSFSSPTNSRRFRYDSESPKLRPASPSPHFSPVLTPYPTPTPSSARSTLHYDIPIATEPLSRRKIRFSENIKPFYGFKSAPSTPKLAAKEQKTPISILKSGEQKGKFFFPNSNTSPERRPSLGTQRSTYLWIQK